MGKHQASGHLQ
jgi:preprotein translocase subunit SecF